MPERYYSLAEVQHMIREAEQRALQAARDTVLAYANERLVITNHPNMSEDITAALRVAAKRIDALRNESSDTGTKVPTGYDGQWHRDLYGEGE